MSNILNIFINNCIEEINIASNQWDDFFNNHNLQLTDILQLNLILDELLSNIIRHGFKDNLTHKIDINFAITNDDIFITVIDDGIEFNPINNHNKKEIVDLDSIAAGGLGIDLILHYSDKISYHRMDNKNFINIQKILNKN